MNVPDFPLLVPEYSNPLFLKLLCESLSRTGEKTLPRGATGVTRLFERFLTTANHRLSGPARCDYRKEADPVSKVVESLGRTMLETNEDWVPIEDFEAACTEALPSREWDRSLAKGLVDEGVVARDYFIDREVIRLSYQRLSDHTQAARLIDANEDAEIRSFVAQLEADGGGFYGRSGLLEALAIQLPEKRGVELHDLVEERHHPTIREAFLGSIIWRDPECFDTQQLSDYVNSLANHMHWYRSAFVETVLQVACVPGHPFNADKLSGVLASMSMPDRDAWWTTHINRAWKGESVVWRLIDWARSPQQERADDETARLAAITLSWFLASSNRALRDCATKALVTLLPQRAPVLVDLLGRFESVDDVYIAERLYCAAYGCALSSTDDNALGTLAGAVYDALFASGEPPAHLMLRDYARGVVETAVHRGVLPARIRLDLVRPPYESPWPVRPPSEEALDRRAPLETHRALHASLASSLGDFSRYTVGSAVRHFEAPNQKRRRRRRRDAERADREAAIAELDDSWSEGQRALLAARGDGGELAGEFWESLNDGATAPARQSSAASFTARKSGDVVGCRGVALDLRARPRTRLDTAALSELRRERAGRFAVSRRSADRARWQEVPVDRAARTASAHRRSLPPPVAVVQHRRRAVRGSVAVISPRHRPIPSRSSQSPSRSSKVRGHGGNHSMSGSAPSAKAPSATNGRSAMPTSRLQAM